MAFRFHELRDCAVAFTRHRRTRKIVIWLAAIVIAIGVLGGLAAPPIVRSVLSNRLTQALHRDVEIQQVRINPYALALTVRGFLMRERQNRATAIAFDELYVNLELQSLFRRGPVIKELRLVKPYVNLVRNEDLRYNYQDLIDQFVSGPSVPSRPSGPTPRFALNNIEIVDGQIDFDDRPEHAKHTVSSIHIGVPFISSIPSDAEIKIHPSFSALVNGAPVRIGGDSMPFAESRQSAIQINIDKLQIPKYVEYSPVQLKFKVTSGEINGSVKISFEAPKKNPSLLAVSGDLALHDLTLHETDDTPLLNVPSLAVVIDSWQVFAGKAMVRSVKSHGTEIHLARLRDGNFNFASLIEAPAGEPSDKPEQSQTRFVYHVGEIVLDSGKLHFTDHRTATPYTTRLDNIRLSARGLTNAAEQKAGIELFFESAAHERFAHSATVQLSPLRVSGKIDIEGFRPAELRPYYQDWLAAEVRDGSVDLSTTYSFEQKENSPDVKLSELNLGVRGLRVDLPGQPESFLRASSLAIKNSTVDLAAKTIIIGLLEGQQGTAFIRRSPDGAFNYTRAVKTTATNTGGNQAVKADDSGWKFETKQIALERFNVNFDDRKGSSPSKINISELSLRGENFSNAKNRRGKATLRARINNGPVTVAGTIGGNPATANLIVEGQQIDLLPIQPYITDQMNLSLTSGRFGMKGKILFDGSGAGPIKLNYTGNVQLQNLASVEKDGMQELLRWKSLSIEGVQFALEPLQVKLNEITLTDFYSRLILEPDGKLNLRKLTATKPENETAAEPSQPNSPVQTAERPTEQNNVTIGKINLRDGNINFSDYLIKPNYSANLTGVQGVVSELNGDTPGDLDVVAKLDNAAPVEIRGKVDPLAKDLYLDIVADAREIDMNPFSPYSGKYVGYGIEKGKLSFHVKYKLENRKLTAENKIILNQLTFGDRVESPDATKLPVLFAVALLKDRNGVIDVDLPISGSLDDPQFSVGGIVLRLVINLITRAVTAPFALLGAAFGGGGGQELSHIEFDYGRADLTPATETRIKTLGTAMSNRPALKVEIVGRVDPVNDRDGLKRVSLQRKVKAQKMKDLVRQGNAPASLDEVRVDKAEYERYLKAAYGEEKFPKPRNLIGLAKDLPAPEMESLILQHVQVTDDDVRNLGNRRAEAVRDRLLLSGQVEADRVFIAGAQPVTSEEQGAAKASRVDFLLK